MKSEKEAAALRFMLTFGCGAIMRFVSTLLMVLSFAYSVQAAPGDLDVSFGGDGRVTTDFSGLTDEVLAIAIQADGKIVVAGRTNPGIGTGIDFALARYNPDGSLDATFGSNGIVTTDFAIGGDTANALAIQADGKIVAAGIAFIGSNDFALARYLGEPSILNVESATGAGIVTFATSAGGFSSLVAVPEASLPAAGKPVGVAFPFGFFSWTVSNLTPGETITVTMTFPQHIPSNAQFWKVMDDTWTDATSSLGDDDGDKILTLAITDGGFGDADGLVNGQISDPGGLGLGASITVVIDIKPGSFPNSINPRSQGVIPVAILTTGTFDAAAVDAATVRFGATGTEAVPRHAALKDVDGDGDINMILHFDTQSTGIWCGDTAALLTGETDDGQAFEGSDSIVTVCK